MKILFRIVAILLSIGVFAAAFFAPIFSGQIVVVGMSLAEEFSLYDLITLAFPSGDGSAFNPSEFLETLKKSIDVIKPLIAPVINLVVFFVLSLLTALATIVINCIKPLLKKTTMFLSLGGVLCIIASFISMNAFASHLISGEINIFSIFDLSFLLSLATSLVEIKALTLGSGAYLMLFAFIGIFIWALSYFVIEIGDPKAKNNPSLKERKRK